MNLLRDHILSVTPRRVRYSGGQWALLLAVLGMAAMLWS